MYTYKYPKADNTSSVICFHQEAGDRDKVALLVIRRGKAPYQGMLALPGGFLNVMEETLKRCAQRELAEETGIAVALEDLVLICVQSEPQRDPRNHVIDHVYGVQVPLEKIEQAQAGDDAAELVTLGLERQMGVVDSDWAFDHADSVRRFFARCLGWL